MIALFPPTAEAMGYGFTRPLNRPEMPSISPLQGACHIVARSFMAGPTVGATRLVALLLSHGNQTKSDPISIHSHSTSTTVPASICLVPPGTRIKPSIPLMDDNRPELYLSTAVADKPCSVRFRYAPTT